MVISSNGAGVTLDSTTVVSPEFLALDVDDATGETFTLTVNDGALLLLLGFIGVGIRVRRKN